MGIPGQALRGFVGQGLDGARRAVSPRVWVYPAASDASTSHTFTAVELGWYRFVAWGPGGGIASSPGGGGALAVVERPLMGGQTVALTVGGSHNGIGSLADTTLTFPNGEIITAGRGGNAGAGGVATINAGLGDIGVSGTAAAGTIGGDAGSSGTYLGGKGSASNSSGGSTPGGGSGTNSVGPSSAKGGEGLIVVTQVRLRP
jgi:hypothetical protein